MKRQSPNKAGAGNGAGSLLFHVEHRGRAVPDLIRCRIQPVRIASQLLVVVALLAAGCDTSDTQPWRGGTWDNMAAPLSDAEAMRGVRDFVAVYGWTMSTNHFLAFAGNQQLREIVGLPWRGISSRSFRAMTHNGILYVPLRGFGAESFGVAYNPETNRFAATISGFKPIGHHWYAWKQAMGHHTPEEKEYEGEE